MLKYDNDKENRMALANRTKEALDSLGWGGKVRIAEKCGVTPQAVTGWLSTGRIDKENLSVISEITGYQLEWLITGKGEQKKSPSKTIDSNATRIGSFDAWDENTPLNDDEVALPFFREVELAAGSGRYEVVENHGPKLRFAKSTLKKQGVSPANAACVTVSGNSMEPAIPDGATIGIDTSNTIIKNGDIYAIDHDGHLRVKLVYRMPGDAVRLRSFNSDEWPDEHYTGEYAAKIKIIGRVFWWSVLR